MKDLSAAVRAARWRLRTRAKALCYSGFARDRWQRPDDVVRALGLVEGDRVADIGAGAGYFTTRLARAVGAAGQVYAVDTDPDMVSAVVERAAAEGAGNVVAVQAPPDDPALPDTVDVAVIVDALHHLPDPGAYAKALGRYFLPRGKLAVIETLPRWYLFGHSTEPDDIRATVEAAGYALVERHEFLPKQSFLVFERRSG